MPKGHDPRQSGESEAVSAPTLEHAAVTPSPTPTPQNLTPEEVGFMSGADTAVATRSQQMAAQSAPLDPEGDTESAAEPVTSDDGLMGKTLLERYQITNKIGQGGMGAVYEAKHTLIGKRVAVKVLLDKYAQRDQIVARLEQEARLASSIGHENIIDITDFGTTPDGRTFVVMEYLEGESLAQLVAREGKLSEQRTINIALQIASALGAAHKKGVIHRDVKPENVFMLKRSGKDYVKVVDFGISKSLRPAESEDGYSPRLTQTGMVLGTPLYMSPEQARGDDELDHRIDIYALGVIIYEMLTAEVPFRGNNYLSIISQVINEQPKPPHELRDDISLDLESVVMKALAKDADERYQSMEELAQDLTLLKAIDGSTTSRGRISAARFWKRQGKKKDRLRILAWVAGLAVVAAAVVVTVVMLGGDPKSKNAAAAQPPPADAGVKRAAYDAAVPAKKPNPMTTIRIVSIPEGAVVYRGSRRLKKTPFDFKVDRKKGEVALTAKLNGFHRAKFVVDPRIDQKVTIELEKVRKKKQPHKTRITRVRRPAPKKTPKKPPTKPNDGKDPLKELTPSPYKNP